MRIVKEEREALQRKDNKPRVVWRRNGRTDAWCTNLTAGELSAETWNKNFRMSEEEFKNLQTSSDPSFPLTIHLQTTWQLLLKKSWL